MVQVQAGFLTYVAWFARSCLLPLFPSFLPSWFLVVTPDPIYVRVGSSFQRIAMLVGAHYLYSSFLYTLLVL